MKILHTGDWHIGDFPGPEKNGVNSRAADTLSCIEAIYHAAFLEEPDVILISGDIFHAAQVWAARGLAETEQACKVINDMSNTCPVVVLRGTPNHDGDKQFDMMQAFFKDDQNVKIITTPQVVELNTCDGDLQVVGLPGFDRGYFRAKYHDEIKDLSPEDENRLITSELQNILLGLKSQCNTYTPSVLMAHYTVPGCTTESGQIQLFSGAEPVILPETLAAAGFDLVALGHIHRPQKVEGCRDTYYCGAPNALTFNDEGQERGFWMHELEPSLPYDRLTHSEFHLTPSRKFLTLHLDDNDISAWNSSEIERQNVSLKWHGHAEGAIVRVIYSCTEENNKAFVPSTMEQSLYNEGAFWVAGILPDKIFPSVSRQELTETTDPEQNLIRYLEEKELLPQRAAAVLDAARPIIARATASSGEGRGTGAMVPLSIEVKNYRKYADERLDFTGLDYCTVNGKNGAGKSSLFMDAILDCLFEEPREGDLTGWISAGEEARSGAITFTFMLGPKTYRVARSRAKSGKATLNLAELADGEWLNCSREKIRDTQQEICNLIGMDSLTLRSCALIMQDQYGLFMEANKERRMAIFSNLLNLGVYGDMEELARQQAAEVSREINKRKILIEGHLPEIAAEDDLRQQLQETQDTANAMEQERRGLSESLEHLRESLSEKQQAANRLDELALETAKTSRQRVELAAEVECEEMSLGVLKTSLAREPEIMAGVRLHDELLKQEKELISGAALYEGRCQALAEDRLSLNEMRNTIANLAITRTQLSNQLESLDETLTRRNQLTRAANRYTTESNRLSRMEARAGTYIALSETLEQVRRKQNELVAVYNAEHARRATRMEALKQKTALLGDSGCPTPDSATCRFLADARAAQSELAACRNDLQVWEEAETAKIMEARKQVEDLERQREALQYDAEATAIQRGVVESLKIQADEYAALANVREEQGRLQERLTASERSLRESQERAAALEESADKLAAEVDEYKDIADRHAAVQRQIADTGHWLAEEKELPVLREKKAGTEKRLAELRERLAELDRDILAKQGDRVRLEESAAGMEDTRRQVDNAAALLDQQQKKLDELKVQAGGLMARIERIEKLKQENADMQSEISAFADRAALYDLLRQAFSPDGIPHNIVVSVLPRLTACANSILGQMTGGKMGMEFVTEKTLKSNKDKEIAALDVKITEGGRQSIGYQSKSGGEKVKAALSAALALSEIQAITTGIRPGFLFIDEPPFLDDEGTQAYCDALDTIKAKYPDLKIITITHDPTMKARFPQSIEVVKDDGGSRIIAA